MKRKWRFHTKFNFDFLIHGFNLQIWKWGDLFPITKASHSYIFLSTSVNDTQGLMCLKNRSNFSCKLHPTRHAKLKYLREYLHILFQVFSVPSLTWWMMHSLVGRPPCPRRLTRCWTPGASPSLRDHHHLLQTCRSLNQDQPLPPPSLPRNRSKIYFCFVVIIFWFIFVRPSFLASLSD